MDETLGRLVGRQPAAAAGMRAEDLRATSPAGRQRRAYLDALMASARGLPPDKTAELLRVELALAAGDADPTKAKAVWGGAAADVTPDVADTRAQRRRLL
jgi:hypothetical protein